LMSGKRNNLEDFIIVQLERSRLLGPYDGKLDSSARLAGAPLQDMVDPTKDQLFG